MKSLGYTIFTFKWVLVSYDRTTVVATSLAPSDPIYVMETVEAIGAGYPKL